MPNPANDLYPSTGLFPDGGGAATSKELAVSVSAAAAAVASFIRTRVYAVGVASSGVVTCSLTISPPPPPGLVLTPETGDSLTLVAEASDSLTLEPEVLTVL